MSEGASSSPCTSVCENKFIYSAYPHNRIPVFISSSMKDEGDFSWSSLRREIDKKLMTSPIFIPFCIEDRVSCEQSRSYYLSNIDQSGIVVSIIREELRSGTEDEIRRAIDLHKPLMLILIGSNRDEATEKLIRHIEDADYCTYTTIDNRTAHGIADFILEQLNLETVHLFQRRQLDSQASTASATSLGDTISYAIPRTSISAFGTSSFLIAERFGYDASRQNVDTENPFLEPLGKKVVAWLLEGTPFNPESFSSTICMAMETSGISADILRLRQKALGSFLSKNYKSAYELSHQASAALPEKDSWLYGNCLIDNRNLSQLAVCGGADSYLAIQKEISSLEAPVTFPLATYYASNALAQTLKTERSHRAKSPNSVIYDNALYGVLCDLSSYAFVSTLYGSIASLAYSRVLIAHSLLDYADLYGDDTLAFEGMKLLILAGEVKEFASQFHMDREGVSHAVKAGADDLWLLSEKGPAPQVPAMRCALIQQAVPYFSDSVFSEVENYLSDNPRRFISCRQEWLKSIDEAKLRMHSKRLSASLTTIISEKLYVSAAIVGKIITGGITDAFAEEELLAISAVLKERAADLIKNGMSLEAIATIEDRTGESIVDSDLLSLANQIERNAYCSHGAKDDAMMLSCIDELKKQYEHNNVPNYYADFSYRVAPTICSLLNQDCATNTLSTLASTLGEIVDTIPSYQGVPRALDEPIAVLCKYACFMRLSGREVPANWVDVIKTIDETHFQGATFDLFAQFDRDVWRVRIRALRTAFKLTSGLSYLTDGISFERLSHHAKLAYLESLEWLLSSGIINDDHSVLAKRICAEISRTPVAQARIKAAHCLAACSKRWGMKDIDGAVSSLTRDPSDGVTFEILRLCKDNSFGDRDFERRTLELLSTDSNWFIRWHANKPNVNI